MAKTRRAKKQTDLVTRANRATPSEAGSFVEEFDRIEQEREEELRALDVDMKRQKRVITKKHNEDQAAVLADGKRVGVSKGLIRALATAQKDRRKAQTILDRADGRLDKLDAEDRDYAIDIRTALGEDFASFGLGAAAVEREDDLDDSVDAKPDPVAAAADKVWKAQDGAGAPPAH